MRISAYDLLVFAIAAVTAILLDPVAAALNARMGLVAGIPLGLLLYLSAGALIAVLFFGFAPRLAHCLCGGAH